MSGIVNDETKISVFRDGRFTQNMIMAAVKVDELNRKIVINSLTAIVADCGV